MFLFEKSLIGVYSNKLNDLKEWQDPFLCYGRIKANSAGKNPNVTNTYTKAGSPNRRTAHFFMSQNDHHLGDVINFDCFISVAF